MRSLLFLTIVLGFASSQAAIVSTSGTVVVETSPHAPEADGVIHVYLEKTSVPFVDTQPLNFGSIVAGTMVDSHYFQFDPASPSGIVGSGSVTFDGPILGVITSTNDLTADLSPDVAATSDQYFGLEDVLGPYPPGADPSARGLGSPEDDLIVTIGSSTLDIDSLEIPPGGAGNVDGFRVLTQSISTAAPGLSDVMRWLAALVLLVSGFVLRRRLDLARS